MGVEVRAPRALPLIDEIELVSMDETSRGHRGVGVSDLSIVELYPPLGREVLDEGYEIISSENEGTDAEIFFARQDGLGVFRLRRGRCEERVTVVKITYQPERQGT